MKISMVRDDQNTQNTRTQKKCKTGNDMFHIRRIRLFTQRRNSYKKNYKSETEYLSSDENHLHFDPYVIFGV